MFYKAFDLSHFDYGFDVHYQLFYSLLNIFFAFVLFLIKYYFIFVSTFIYDYIPDYFESGLYLLMFHLGYLLLCCFCAIVVRL